MAVLNDVETLSLIIDNIKENKRVCFFRYGDVDYMMMYPDSVGKVIGRNNQSSVTKEIREKTIEGYNICDESYFIGTVHGYSHKRSTGINVDSTKIKSLELTHHDRLYSAIAFQETFFDAPDLFLEFIRLINKKRTLYINHYIDDSLEKYYGKINHHIKVPQRNATSVYQNVLDQLGDVDGGTFDQIILSAGNLSRVIAKDLWCMFPEKNVFDIGSTTDVLVSNTPVFSGLSIRSHIRDNMGLIKKRLSYFEEMLK